jgi:membrane-associated HD superfamily phosphohydrolase
MPEIQKTGNSARKYYINLIFFLLSIIIVTAIWPHTGKRSLATLAGALVIVFSCFFVLYLFLSHFRSEVMEVTRKTLFIILTILSFVVLTRIVISLPDHRMLFLIPFAVIPVIIRTFYDARLALFILLITIMLAGFMVADPFGFVFMNFISGMVAIFTLTNIYRKGKLFFTALMVFITFSGLYLGLSLADNGNLGNVIWSDFVLIAANGILILLGYPLIFIFETKFLFLSDATLVAMPAARNFSFR